MTLLASTVTAFEAALLPDVVRKQAVSWLVGAARKRLANSPAGFEQSFADAMTSHPIAEHADAANVQHYELPSAFFEQILGPRRKYSCCLYDEGVTSLADAEDRARWPKPAPTPAWRTASASWSSAAAGARSACGWPSAIPLARITAVSNSATQRAHIEAQAQRARPRPT